MIADVLIIFGVAAFLEVVVYRPARRREQERREYAAFLRGLRAANAIHNATCPAAVAAHQ